MADRHEAPSRLAEEALSSVTAGAGGRWWWFPITSRAARDEATAEAIYALVGSRSGLPERALVDAAKRAKRLLDYAKVPYLKRGYLPRP